MKKQLPIIAASLALTASTVSVTAFAAQNGPGGSSQRSMQNGFATNGMEGDKGTKQKRSEKMEMKGADSGQGDMEREMEREHDRDQKMDADGKPGFEKQREKKMAQEQKELGKGSEQGQESREKRRKWWRFWE